jgi:4-hydroxy 2-oxovalerate aldolase
MMISCIIPCAKTDIDNINLRKFSNTSLLELKLDVLKELPLSETILSSNDLDVKKILVNKQKNIKFDLRPNDLCINNVKHHKIYKYFTQLVKNDVILHTTVTCPFISKNTLEYLINYWHNNDYDVITIYKNNKNYIKCNDTKTLNNSIQDIKYLNNYFELLPNCCLLFDKNKYLKYENIFDSRLKIKLLNIDDIETFSIRNNTDFLIAESIFYRNLNSNKNINDHMLNYEYSKTKILDCTIRDSGYLNNWNWTYETVRDFVYYMGEIGIEYCEIGFILDNSYSEKDCGIWRTLNKDYSIISKLKRDTNTKTKIAVMFDIGDYDKYYYDYNLIPDKKETNIDLIRICCFHQIIEKSKDIILNLKSKGYELTLNIMYASHLTNNDIIKIKKFVQGLPIKYLYFADSIGGLTGNDISKFFVNLKDIHPIKNGFHNHDNNGTVFNNIDNILKHNIDIIDTTIFGFGKNGGNCPFELIVLYLILKENYNYNLIKVLEFYNKLQNIIFYENVNINLDKIKKILQQFLNIHPVHVKKYNNLNLMDYYNNIKELKNKSKYSF